MRNVITLDTQTTSPDNRRGGLVLDGAGVYNNYFYNLRISKQKNYNIAWLNGAFRNHVEIAGYWGSNLAFDDVGSGGHNTVTILPDANDVDASVSVKPTLTGSAGNLRIMDERKEAMRQGTSTQSGDASTKAFNIAHGCFTTPGYFTVFPTSSDASGNPVLSVTSTNIVVTYPIAPPSGTSNLSWEWKAEITY